MTTAITCACGKVRIEARGEPLISVICHCNSCRTAGRAFDTRSRLPPVVDASGGSAIVLWRKDRVRCVSGSEFLEPHRLKAHSPTRRFTSRCCQTPLFMDFTKGFWASVYRDRVPDAPAPRMRVMTGNAPSGIELPDDELPHLEKHSGALMLRLLGTWLSMGFGRPKIAGVSD